MHASTVSKKYLRFQFTFNLADDVDSRSCAESCDFENFESVEVLTSLSSRLTRGFHSCRTGEEPCIVEQSLQCREGDCSYQDPHAHSFGSLFPHVFCLAAVQF
jgi:hypothetical protein